MIVWSSCPSFMALCWNIWFPRSRRTQSFPCLLSWWSSVIIVKRGIRYSEGVVEKVFVLISAPKTWGRTTFFFFIWKDCYLTIITGLTFQIIHAVLLLNHKALMKVRINFILFSILLKILSRIRITLASFPVDGLGDIIVFLILLRFFLINLIDWTGSAFLVCLIDQVWIVKEVSCMWWS